jgi:hypothetical protein
MEKLLNWVNMSVMAPFKNYLTSEIIETTHDLTKVKMTNGAAACESTDAIEPSATNGATTKDTMTNGTETKSMDTTQKVDKASDEQAKGEAAEKKDTNGILTNGENKSGKFLPATSEAHVLIYHKKARLKTKLRPKTKRTRRTKRKRKSMSLMALSVMFTNCIRRSPTRVATHHGPRTTQRAL